jgi:uncharacterized FlaG/YvyC family protein
MLIVTNLSATSTNPERETGPRPSAPPSPLGDPRREPSASFGLGADQAEEEHEFGREGRSEDQPSATAASTKGEALQAQALVATLGEERARLAYDEKLSRMFVEILDPKTGDVITRFPPERLVEQLNSLAADDKADAAPVEGLSKLIGAVGGATAGKVLDELV